MKEIGVAELRIIQMQILDYVDAFCRKHDVKYTISGGTLLGAIRHGGYIPWDDDIDIQMLRDEYNRFTMLWNKQNEHGYYELVNIESGNNMGYPFGKIHDTRTETYIGKLLRTGVFIDVFPVDNVVDEIDFCKRHHQIKKLYRKRSAAFNRMLCKYERLNIKRRIFHFFLNPYQSRETIAEKINIIAKAKNQIKTDYVFEMTAGLKCKNMIPRRVFESYKDLAFENRYYMSVEDTDTYLVQTFGDYMALPPVEKQVSDHGFVAYWKNQ